MNPEVIQGHLLTAWQWLLDHVLVWSTAIQAGIIVLTYIVARASSGYVARGIDFVLAHDKVPHWTKPTVGALVKVGVPLVWLVTLWFAFLAATGAEWPSLLIRSAVSLLTAWVVIRFASGFIRNPRWAKTLAVTAWTMAALNLLGLLEPTLRTLDAMALSLGDIRISVLGLAKAVLVFALMLWIAGIVSRQLESKLAQAEMLSPSARVLLGKLLQILVIVIAVITALEIMGVDLTALAVFGGAIGLGIGFGLQKVISNLMSGVILLMDKSVKPGDVIAVGNTFGWINRLSARYVSVITRDGTEHLIPNENLISQEVENWSYTDSLIRLKLPIGIAYESDVPKAMELAVDAAKDVDRVQKSPAPVCRLMNFGADAIELELRVWINDPQRGVANVTSDVLLNVWHAYKDGGIEFPFSQRDLHLRSAVPLDVQVTTRAAAEKDAEG